MGLGVGLALVGFAVGSSVGIRIGGSVLVVGEWVGLGVRFGIGPIMSAALHSGAANIQQ